MLIDTHCHLNVMVKKEFDVPLQPSHFPAIADIVDQAQAAGVGKIINVGTSLVESQNSIDIARAFQPVFATVGVHPCDCFVYQTLDDLHKVVKQLDTWLKDKEDHKIVAVGEVGLDFFHKPYDLQRQVDFFKAQIELALKYKLPVAVHVRDAGDEVLRVLEEYVQNKLRGVIHCFVQPYDFAQQVVEWGYCVGMDAPIGYPKNVELRETIKKIPLDRIILETDAPFLPPQQYRGKSNTPVYLPMVAQLVADIKEIDREEVEQATTANAEKLFGI